MSTIRAADLYRNTDISELGFADLVQRSLSKVEKLLEAHMAMVAKVPNVEEAAGTELQNITRGIGRFHERFKKLVEGYVTTPFLSGSDDAVQKLVDYRRR